MFVERPTGFNVSLTDKEDEILCNCIEIIEKIQETLRINDCSILQWKESGDEVNSVDLIKFIENLETLRYVDTMF